MIAEHDSRSSPDENTSASERTRALNDLLRRTGQGGTVVVTAGIEALGEAALREILQAVASYEVFGEDNDPHGEHDCAVLEAAGQSIIFKIDYYDARFEMLSADPANPEVTRRVLTIMLANEY
jgi:hypothetical protein